jgi:two-component system, OmpR family, osmolarity sensor histidine kinase EnvZ
VTTLDIGIERLRTAAGRASGVWEVVAGWIKGKMPAGLYPRSLLIIIAPMVILQSVVAFVFMERHWNTVTRRLSAAVTQDISSLIDVYRSRR